jgi:dethiobiotin synthetase
MKPQFPNCFFVTGIGTDVGKTVTSAILCKALHADYWKPVQAGGLDKTDSDFVKSFGVQVHTEAYKLNTPASPHHAAALEGKIIDLEKIVLPETNNHLLIEGAGGVMVPLNEQELILDLIVHLNVPVIVISKNYLGSINHTILTCEMLNAAGVEILGIIFNGASTPSSEEWILNFTDLNLLGNIPLTEEVSKAFVEEQAIKIRAQMGLNYSL